MLTPLKRFTARAEALSTRKNTVFIARCLLILPLGGSRLKERVSGQDASKVKCSQ